MPTRDGYREGIPCWVDLSTHDVTGATAFYTALFGWEFVEAGPEGMPYWMAMQKGLPAAGVGAAADGGQPVAWTSYFAVEDAAATAERVEAAGGQVMVGPDRVMDQGAMAICMDPTGAVFGIWEADSHFGAAIVNEHGALNWNELTTDDMDTAIPFYEAVFGHRSERTQTGSGRPYTTLSVGERAIAGAMGPPVPEIPNHWGIYFAVDDIADARQRAESNGATLVFDLMEVPDVGTFLGIKHPAGGTITLIQLASPID